MLCKQEFYPKRKDTSRFSKIYLIHSKKINFKILIKIYVEYYKHEQSIPNEFCIISYVLNEMKAVNIYNK